MDLACELERGGEDQLNTERGLLKSCYLTVLQLYLLRAYPCAAVAGEKAVG